MSGLLPLATELRTSMVVRLVPQLHRASCIDMSDYQDFLGRNLRVPSRNLRLNWMRSTKRQFSGCPMTHCLIPRLNIKLMRDAVISSAAIHIVSPAQFDRATAQTPGSERRAAIAPALGIASAIWGGLYEVEPGSRTGIHHHGEQETIAYVLSGICEIRWGEDRAQC